MTAAPRHYTYYGEVDQLWRYLEEPERAPKEVLFEGVPGSAKTRGILEWIRAVIVRYPGTRVLFLGSTRRRLTDSVLKIWEEQVLGVDHPACKRGGHRSHKDRYLFPYTEVVCAGYDDPTKAYSTEWDIIYYNEVQMGLLGDWEKLQRGRRASGEIRINFPTKTGSTDARRLPFRLLIADCNPEDQFHWVNQRACKGGGDHAANECPARMHRLIGRFWDNPIYFDREKGRFTASGLDFIFGLQESLTGVRYMRLFLGQWAQAEGLVWGPWDPAAHLLYAKVNHRDDGTIWLDDIRPGMHGLSSTGEGDSERVHSVELLWFIGAQDIGFDSPGCAQLFGFDSERRAYCVAECYRRHWDHGDWAKVWAEWFARFQPMRKIVTDHDPSFQSDLRTQLLANDTPGFIGNWSKKRGKEGEKTGIDVVRRRLKKRKDGTRGLYYLRDRMAYWPDPDLKGRFHPTSFEEEVSAWCYPPFEERTRHDEPTPDPQCPDHACDTTRGAMDWAEGKDLSDREQPQGVIPGSARDVLDRAKKGQKII